MNARKVLFFIVVLAVAFNFCLLAQGPPPPPGGGGGPSGVPLDGASGMIVLGALGALYKKYNSKKKDTSGDSTPI